jgi:hypothetical protein
MTQCVFLPVAADRYCCRFCGFEVRSGHTPDRIHRACPQAPEAMVRAVEELRRDLRSRVARGVALRSWEEIESLIAACAACKDFGLRSCLRLRGCDARQKWLSLFTFGRCAKWPKGKEEGGSGKAL